MSAIFLPEDVCELLKGKTVIYIGDSGILWFEGSAILYYWIVVESFHLGLNKCSLTVTKWALYIFSVLH